MSFEFEMQVHIVYMGDKPKTNVFVASMHHSMLENVLGRFVNTYKLLLVSN